jgi:hypothetical protein
MLRRLQRFWRVECAVADGNWYGLHAAPLKDGYEPLGWRAADPRTQRVRVRSRTCECERVAYALCRAGGLMFIRRTVRTAGGVEVSVTDWFVGARAERLWGLLLKGFVG